MKYSSTKKNILVYIQDVGGAAFILSFLDKLIMENSQFNYLILAHPLSVKLANNCGCISKVINEKFPIKEQRIESILVENKIAYILCTLSSLKLDKTNAKMIAVARQKGIPTLGFMDHWKGFDRVLNDEEVPEYCPGWIGVIDENSKKNLEKKIDDRFVVRVVGHPVLEKITVLDKRSERPLKILFVSQPNIESPEFPSLFEASLENQTLLQLLANKVPGVGSRYLLYYRPHPKEKSFTSLPYNVSLDLEDKQNIFCKYDIFIGFDSILLFEAYLSGTKVISLSLHEVYDSDTGTIPYVYSKKISSIDEFEEIFTSETIDSPKLSSGLFENSGQKCVSLFTEFVSN